MSNEEILNLWDCNKLTCGEVVELARADERKKALTELRESIMNCPFSYLVKIALDILIDRQLKGVQK